MNVITIRNLPTHLAKAIQKRARIKKTSMNKAVIGLLEEHLGASTSKPHSIHHDLDTLAGSWTKEEALTFEKTLLKQRTIDPQLWK
ncbi:MAG: hypothetical protein NPIRA02_24550 [Nitrospirales bacterium]|nr:MAG: hypothetical protein NPIRA02_24550 [Nitrospirales bacterium]